MTVAKVRDSANGAWLELNSVASIKVRNAENTGWITKTAQQLGFRDASNTGWIYNDSAAWIPPNPYTINLIHNDLDFVYSETIPSNGNPDGSLRLTFTLNFDDFFTAGGDHIPICLNAQVPSPNQPSGCDIIRNGFNLFSQGRGFYIKAGTNQVYYEHWNGTSSPATGLVANTVSGSNFSPATYPIVDVTIRAGFRTGTYAELMIIEIRDEGGVLRFSGSAGLGWDTALTYVVAIGGIATGYIAPTPAGGCIETTKSGIAPNASATLSNIQLVNF